MLSELEISWKKLLEEEYQKEYFKSILSFLEGEQEAGKVIYPESQDIFSAFKKTPVDRVKIVILGQDPYHGEGQAHGLSFSVQKGVKIPPSLRNIYKELQSEYPKFNIPEFGNLTAWAQQGVLLLNSILTVEKSKPASHAKCGWADFTDSVLKNLSKSKEGIIFVLWGNFARSKKALIDTDKHFVLESPHPSPFSAYNGFFGNGHFKEINKILKKQGKNEINW